MEVAGEGVLPAMAAQHLNISLTIEVTSLRRSPRKRKQEDLFDMMSDDDDDEHSGADDQVNKEASAWSDLSRERLKAQTIHQREGHP